MVNICVWVHWIVNGLLWSPVLMRGLLLRMGKSIVAQLYTLDF